MIEVVLDASAMLAFLNDEPGGDQVLPYLGRAVLSAVNYAEVLTVLSDVGIKSDALATEQLPWLKVVHFEPEHARLSAALRQKTKSSGLSLGDRACLALAKTLALPVLTADRIWKTLDIGVEVRLIR